MYNFSLIFIGLFFSLHTSANTITAADLYHQVSGYEPTVASDIDLTDNQAIKDIADAYVERNDPRNSLFRPTANLSPTRMLSLEIPVNMKQRPQESLTVGFDSANNFVEEIDLDCIGESCDVNLSADHIARRYFVTYSRPILNEESMEIEFQAAILEIVGGSSVIDYFVSDGFIRDFHETIGNSEVREGTPNDQANFNGTSQNGKSIQLEKGKAYILPVRVSLNHYKSLFKNAKTEITVNTGIHLSIPIGSSINKSVDVGGSANLVTSHQFNKSWKIYGSLGFALQMNNLTNNNSIAYFGSDARSTTHYSVMSLDVEHTNKKGNRRCHIGFAYQLRKNQADGSDYTASSVASLGDAETRLMFQPTETVTIGTGCTWNEKHSIELQLVEDTRSICKYVDDEELLGCGQTNASDFHTMLSYTLLFD